MQIADLLKADGVKLIASATSKKRLFHSIGELAASCYGLNATDVVEALVERESLGPTSVGHGIALPHARLDGLDRVCGLFIRLEKPLDVESWQLQPVQLAFELSAPS